MGVIWSGFIWLSMGTSRGLECTFVFDETLKVLACPSDWQEWNEIEWNYCNKAKGKITLTNI